MCHLTSDLSFFLQRMVSQPFTDILDQCLCPVQYRVLSSTLPSVPTRCHSTHHTPSSITENVSDVKCPLVGGGGAKLSPVEDCCLKEKVMPDPDHFLPQKNVCYRLLKLVVLSFLIPHSYFVYCLTYK